MKFEIMREYILSDNNNTKLNNVLVFTNKITIKDNTNKLAKSKHKKYYRSIISIPYQMCYRLLIIWDLLEN